MGYHNCKIVQQLPGARTLYLPRNGAQTVSMTFIHDMLQTVALATNDYVTDDEIQRRKEDGENLGMDPMAIPRYWFGSWEHLAALMWEKPTPATRNRIRRAWRALAEMGVAKRYCHKTARGWEYTHLLTIGCEQGNDMYDGLTDDDVETDIEDRLLGAYEDLREWKYNVAVSKAA